MTLYALLFTMEAIGVSIASYLIQTRHANAKPVCVIGGGCTEVLESKYNTFFGLVHNDIMGLLFYLFTGFLSALVVIEVGPLDLIELVIMVNIGIGTVMSLYFVGIQAFVLKKWCFWCMMSASTVFGMAFFTVLSTLIS